MSPRCADEVGLRGQGVAQASAAGVADAVVEDAVAGHLLVRVAERAGLEEERVHLVCAARATRSDHGVRVALGGARLAAGALAFVDLEVEVVRAGPHPGGARVDRAALRAVARLHRGKAVVSSMCEESPQGRWCTDRHAARVVSGGLL